MKLTQQNADPVGEATREFTFNVTEVELDGKQIWRSIALPVGSRILVARTRTSPTGNRAVLACCVPSDQFYQGHPGEPLGGVRVQLTIALAPPGPEFFLPEEYKFLGVVQVETEAGPDDRYVFVKRSSGIHLD